MIFSKFVFLQERIVSFFNPFVYKKIGVYIGDSFDFNDSNVKWFSPSSYKNVISQPLGYWNPKTKNVGKIPSFGKYVDNNSFRSFRNRTGKGGDYMNYSDVKEENVNYSFKVPHSILER